MHAGAMHLRLAPDASRGSPGDGVHKASSPFCKVESKRYMLCPYAYGTDASRLTRRTGVCGADRMEVGRRKWSDPLQRSADSRRSAGGDQHRFARRCVARGAFEYEFRSSAADKPVPQFRDLEASASGDDRQFGRGRRGCITLRPRATTRPFASPLSGRSAVGGLPAKCTDLHLARCVSRFAFIERNHPGPAREPDFPVPFSAILCPSGIYRPTAGWACFASARQTCGTVVSLDVRSSCIEPRSAEGLHPRQDDLVLLTLGTAEGIRSTRLLPHLQHIAAPSRGAMS
jgi:hypothetical protein